MNHYQILGISVEAQQSEIKLAYRKLAKKFHPDRNPGNQQAEEKFLEITEAYRVLSDEELKENYDTQIFGKSAEKAGKSKLNKNDKEGIFRAASDFENFFGFKETGEKVEEESDDTTPDFSDMFESFMKKNRRR